MVAAPLPATPPFHTLPPPLPRPQESDLELQQALAHVRVLQQQLDLLRSAHSAAPPPLAPLDSSHTPTATAPSSAVISAPATPAPPASPCLPSAPAPHPHPHVQPSPAVGQAAAASPAQLQAGPELPFLRARVEQLSLECRQLRREALQLRMAAGASPSQALSAPAEAEADTRVPLGPGREVEQGGGGGGVGEAHGAQALEPSAAPVEAQLEEARELAGRLQQENEQLMDMSNALR